MEYHNPRQMAAHLATYIASPTKIESLVLREFRETPPLHEIAEMRYRVELAGKRLKRDPFVRGGAATDHLHWQPATFVPKRGRPPKVPEPPRIRDYILIETNPFLSRDSIARKLVASVARDFRLTPDEICGVGRFKCLVHARAVVAVILRKRNWSYPQIAPAIGRKDHTTVIHAIDHIEVYAKANPTVAASLERHIRLMREADEAGEMTLAA